MSLTYIALIVLFILALVGVIGWAWLWIPGGLILLSIALNLAALLSGLAAQRSALKHFRSFGK